MTAADELRGWVVRRVLNGHLLLAVLLYGLVGYLLVTGGPERVPDALWLAAGAAAQAIYSFLSNSKSEKPEDERGAEPQPVEVVQPAGQPVPVEYAGDA